jgi:hypothetical protein
MGLDAGEGVSLAEIMALIASLVGDAHPYEHKLYADVIERTTQDVTEQRLLVVVAWTGNWFHTYGDPSGFSRRHTPFFDVTEFAQAHPTERISMERGAGLALRFLRLHHEVRCRGMGWRAALGRYHTGRCAVDALAERQWRIVRWSR